MNKKLLVALVAASFVGIAHAEVKEDIKEGAHDVKNGVVDAAHDVKHGAKSAWHATKRGAHHLKHNVKSVFKRDSYEERHE